MSTMLSGAAVMDAALLLIAGNETCPQPQTSEHLAAIEIMKLNHIIILQNKVDLMREEGAQQHYESILKFIRGTVADGSPIIPISAQLKYNIDAINEYLVTKIPVPVRDFSAAPHMIIIRSFDVNKPGAEIDELKGGVAGGSILTGVLKLGDEVEIRPGLVTKDEQGKIRCRPIFSRVISLFAEHNDLKFAVPGGLIGESFRSFPCRGAAPDRWQASARASTRPCVERTVWWASCWGSRAVCQPSTPRSRSTTSCCGACSGSRRRTASRPRSPSWPRTRC